MPFNLREIFTRLSAEEARTVVVGGLAVILHGHLRATRDLDLVVGLDPANCGRAIAAFNALGLRPRLPVALEDFADPAKRADWVENRNMFVLQLWDPANELRSIDVFVREPLEFEALWRNSVVKDYDGTPIRIAGIPDLIAMKSRAGRPRDLDDIAALRAILAESREAGT